ncbi:hypothetical protein ACJA3J_05850 [Halobacillus sp. SY10]|uniref:hypothetical protein n=1 Tax=Halobacillus sp. SY10 TaxID=3381356 RepID=UPI00387A2AE9
MVNYAEINADSICIGIKSVLKEITDENLVEIESVNEDYLFRKYDRETETWSEEKYLPDRPAVQLDAFEKLKADKDQLESTLNSVLQTNAMNLKTMAEQSRQLKDSQSLNADIMLKMARNSIN